MPELLALRSAPPLVNAGTALQASVEDEWQVLRGFYGLTLLAYNGNRQAWAREVRQLMQTDGRNPYFRWFITGGQ
ncbi:hypothetical protein D3C77_732330 [compost metagenome]